jgi:hypothetical protein
MLAAELDPFFSLSLDDESSVLDTGGALVGTPDFLSSTMSARATASETPFP